MKQQIKENVAIEIGAVKSKIKKTQQAIVSESNDAILAIRHRELAELEAVLIDLTEELEAVANKKRNDCKDDLVALIKNQGVEKEQRTHIAYIATDAKYLLLRNYSTTPKRVNLTTQYLNWTNLIGVLNNLAEKPGHYSDLTQDDLRTTFEQANASYMIKTASFDNPKWDSKYVFNLLQIQRDYWAPIDQGLEYSPFFDDLMYSLGGGRAENIEHIEKWVAFKYLYPEQCKVTPGINITGKPGGNGKGMFNVVLTSIFTPMGVTVIKGKNLTGGFNAIMEGKVITVLDDERRDNFPQDELKQNSGNGSIVIEPKGVDAYSVDATANTIVLDNTGLVKLVGGGSAGEDRRWSIISTELTLLEVLAKNYELDESQSKELADQMGKLFEDRLQCGRWVAAMIEKHQVRNMAVLLALHGEDYRARLNEQKDNWIGIFEQILPILVNQGVMPFKFIKEIVEAETGEKIKQPRTLSNKFDEFLSRKGFKNVEKPDVNVHITFDLANSGKIKGAVRRIDAQANTFDYSMISTVPYNKKQNLTRETLQLHDFTENPDDFTEVQNLPRYPATPLTDEKTALPVAVEQDLVSGVKTTTPANPAFTPLGSDTFLARRLAELKAGAQPNAN